jgi:amino acid permease
LVHPHPSYENVLSFEGKIELDDYAYSHPSFAIVIAFEYRVVIPNVQKGYEDESREITIALKTVIEKRIHNETS